MVASERAVRRVALGLSVWASLSGCQGGPGGGPHPADTFQGRPVYTCCNMFFEVSERWISDRNYRLEAMIPAGTPIEVTPGNRQGRVNFQWQGHNFTLAHEYGTRNETTSDYLRKVLLESDPRQRIASAQPLLREAIRVGRIIRGMSKSEVLVAVGYPPADITPTLEMKVWTYYYGHRGRYQIVFNDQGRVLDVSALEDIRNQMLLLPR